MQNNNDRSELERVWSVISHDLASPLFVIQNSLSLIDKELLPLLLNVYKIAKEAGLEVPFIRRDQLEYYQEILQSTESTIETVRQQVARLDRKLLPKLFRSSNQPVDIVNCVKKAIESYQSSYSLKDKSRIHVDLQQATVLGNVEMIQYLLYELFDNAEYEIEANAFDDKNAGVFLSSTIDGNNYHLTIKNNTVPIAPSNLDKLFDAYFTTKHSHIGLGLTFCKKAMQHMQGDIICHTKEDGKIMEFILTFQLC